MFGANSLQYSFVTEVSLWSKGWGSNCYWVWWFYCWCTARYWILSESSTGNQKSWW